MSTDGEGDMKDEEVIEQFLKDNDEQVRRLAWRARFNTLKRIAPKIAIGLFVISIFIFGAIKLDNYYLQAMRARRAIKDAELAHEQEAANSEAHPEAQKAFVVVKYGENNVVTQC